MGGITHKLIAALALRFSSIPIPGLNVIDSRLEEVLFEELAVAPIGQPKIVWLRLPAGWQRKHVP